MDINFGEVFLGAFFGFLASYGVEKLVSWESDKARGRTALRWIKTETLDNLKLLESRVQTPAEDLSHGLFYDHHWESAMFSGALTPLKSPDLLGAIAAVYRDLQDIERWTGIVSEVCFNSRGGAAKGELTRLTHYVRSREQQAIKNIRGLLARSELS